MATAVAAKPGANHQTKMKRPPLPAVQTNGIQSSRSSPSPLTSSKRPPSGFKAPPTPTMSGPPNSAVGVQPRLSQRRKDSQKPGELTRTRAGKDGERKIPKRKQEPYVKTQGHILKKYRNRQPSLVIHLHPNNFRFDQQTGSFSYNSPMKCILEHIKSQTVPHLFIEELVASGVVFYEGCLIVQIKDHRTTKPNNSSAKSTQTKGSNIPSSIHNYTQWVVPSPYVPFPVRKQAEGDNKENDIDGDGANAVNNKEKPNEPKTFTVVLFPTPQSIQEEAFLQANTPDTRSGNRKAGAGAIARTPSSATVPPTPLSAVPSTPIVGSNAAKRLKMSISGAEIQQFESKIIAATAPPMFLEPVKDREESQQLIDALTDPLHRGKHPSPKTRKRTVAELAADERIAAQDQAFMLIMDEKANVTGKAANKDEDGTAPFEPNFETFNAIQQIKAQHDERSQHKQRLDAEQKRLELERNNARRIQLERENQHRIKLEKEREHEKFRLAQQRQKELRAAHMLRQQNLTAQAAAQAQIANAQPIPMQNGYPPVNSSPVVRNATPHSNPSPVIGNIGAQGGVAMQPTSSGQGSSPARPPSSTQHAHPAAGGVQMVHNRSRQQNPSRTSTPQMAGTPNMPNATPNIPHSTPNLQQGTPSSRVSQSSPNAALTAGPNGNMMNPQSIAATAARMKVTPEQFNMMMAHHRRSNEFFNQQNNIVQANQQGTAHQMQQNGQMSQVNMQQATAAQQQQQQNIMQEQRRRVEAVRLQQQQQQQAAAMANLPNGHPAVSPLNPGMNPQQQQQQQHPPGQPPQARPMGPNNGGGQGAPNALTQLQANIAQRLFPQIAASAAQSFGLSHVNQLNPQQIKECKQKALETGLAEANKMKLEQGRRQAMAHQNQNINMYRNDLGGIMRQQAAQQQQQGQGGAMGAGMGMGGAGAQGGGVEAGNQMQQMVQNMKNSGMTQEQIMHLMQQPEQQRQRQQQQPGQQQMHAQHASALQSLQSMNNMGGMGMGNGNMG